jgi:hypothetical protein
VCPHRGEAKRAERSHTQAARRRGEQVSHHEMYRKDKNVSNRSTRIEIAHLAPDCQFLTKQEVATMGPERPSILSCGLRGLKGGEASVEELEEPTPRVNRPAMCFFQFREHPA